MLQAFKTSGGNHYSVKAKYRKTKNGFAHDCIICTPHDDHYTNTNYYINRTWEHRLYQAVIEATFRLIKNSVINDAKQAYKDACNIKRLTAKKQKEFEASSFFPLDALTDIEEAKQITVENLS